MYKIVNIENNKQIVISDQFFSHIEAAMVDYWDHYSSIGYIDEVSRKEILTEIDQILNLLGDL